MFRRRLALRPEVVEQERLLEPTTGGVERVFVRVDPDQEGGWAAGRHRQGGAVFGEELDDGVASVRADARGPIDQGEGRLDIGDDNLSAIRR